MSPLAYGLFDVDNHYYEGPDAFTRHLSEDMRQRCVQWVTIDGRQHHLVGGKLARAVKNPTWNPISMPGSIAPYLHGKELTDEELRADRTFSIFLLLHLALQKYQQTVRPCSRPRVPQP